MIRKGLLCVALMSCFGVVSCSSAGSTAPDGPTTSGGVSVSQGSSVSPPPVRYREPYNEYVPRCLAVFGWEAKAGPGGAVISSVPPAAQQKKREDDSTLCNAEYAKNLPKIESPEDYSKVYDIQILVRRCLSDLGYTGVEPPSRQTYIDARGDVDGWDPWSVVSPQNVDLEDLAALQQQCPPFDPYMLIDGYPRR